MTFKIFAIAGMWIVIGTANVLAGLVASYLHDDESMGAVYISFIDGLVISLLIARYVCQLF